MTPETRATFDAAAGEVAVARLELQAADQRLARLRSTMTDAAGRSARNKLRHRLGTAVVALEAAAALLDEALDVHPLSQCEPQQETKTDGEN